MSCARRRLSNTRSKSCLLYTSSVSDVSYPYFSPYKATVTLPKQDTSVTLTLTLTYNGREDLTVSRVYTCLLYTSR